MGCWWPIVCPQASENSSPESPRYSETNVSVSAVWNEVCDRVFVEDLWRRLGKWHETDCEGLFPKFVKNFHRISYDFEPSSSAMSTDVQTPSFLS